MITSELTEDQLKRLEMIPAHNWQIESGFEKKTKDSLYQGLPKGNITIIVGVTIGKPRLKCADCSCIIEDQKINSKNSMGKSFYPWHLNLANQSYWERMFVPAKLVRGNVNISTSNIPECKELIMENILT